MVDWTLCVNTKCIYRETCWRAIEKHPTDDDSMRQSVSSFDQKKDHCYIPEDGKVL